MKQLITEKHILDLQYAKVSNRPEMVLEGFQQLDNKEQKQINEAYNAVYDIIVSEVIEEASLSGAKAKLKGKFAGGMAALRGDQDAAGAGTQAELQSLFDDLKRNVGTIVAQHEKDVSQLGFKPDSNIVQMLNQIKQTIAQSPAQIEVKDSSIGGKAGEFAKNKALPVVMKAVNPIVSKIDKMYQNSGPIKDFDNRYDKLIGDLTQKYPNMSETIGKFSEVAKQNKGKATFVIGALTAILTATGAFAAGGMAAFVVGVGLRGVYGMLAGEPPAKAFGKATITAAIGKLAGAGIKELFGDVDAEGAGAVEDSGVGPVEAKHNALQELIKKYPDAKNFDDLARLDPEAAQELQKQFALTGSSTSMGAAKDKIDVIMKGNEVTDAGGETGTFRDGELKEVDGLIQVKDAESAIQRILQTTGDDSLHPNAIYGGRPDISFDLTGGGMTIDDVKISFAELDGEQLRNLEAGLKAHNIDDARIWDSMARAARQSGAFTGELRESALEGKLLSYLKPLYDAIDNNKSTTLNTNKENELIWESYVQEESINLPRAIDRVKQMRDHDTDMSDDERIMIDDFIKSLETELEKTEGRDPRILRRNITALLSRAKEMFR